MDKKIISDEKENHGQTTTEKTINKKKLSNDEAIEVAKSLKKRHENFSYVKEDSKDMDK